MKRTLLDSGMEEQEGEMELDSSVPVEIEARMRNTCTIGRDALRASVVEEVIAQCNDDCNSWTYGTLLSLGALAPHIDRLRVCSSPSMSSSFKCSATNPPRVYLYALAPEHSRVDQVGEQEDASMVTFSQWTLPCPEFEGLWESLIFDDDLPVSG